MTASHVPVAAGVRQVLSAPRGQRFNRTRSPVSPTPSHSPALAPERIRTSTPDGARAPDSAGTPVGAHTRSGARPETLTHHEQVLAQMRGNPRVEHRLVYGELPTWMHVAAQRRRTPGPVPSPRPAPDDTPSRPGRELPPLPRRPHSHRKPRRKIGWSLSAYALATAAGALIQHVFSFLL